MNNTISLGQFELQLAEINSTKKGNTISQEELIDQLPSLLDMYKTGKELALSAVNQMPDLDWRTFEKRVQNLQIPKLTESNTVEVFDQVTDEVALAIPAAKAELDAIKAPAGGNSGGNIQALPIIPVVFGLIFLVGVANGVRDGKKKPK